MSVMVMCPSSPAPSPIRAKFLRSSQPIAPAPTLKVTGKKMKLSDVFYNVAESHSSIVAHHYIEIRHSVAPVLPDVLQSLRQR